MKTVFRLIYPPQCITCDALVDDDMTLCGECWRDTPFIAGHVCDQCGTPLPGETSGVADLCDDCMAIARPWARGRAALLYKGNARRLILGLKHGDRLDLVRPAAGWMEHAGRDIMRPDMIVVPVPAHWKRLLKRRYNQAAALAQQIARNGGNECLPDALIRQKQTLIQDGMGRDARFENVAGAIVPHRSNGGRLTGRDVLLIDDVMTSGATLAAASEACHVAGANQVCVLTLARVAKDT